MSAFTGRLCDLHRQSTLPRVACQVPRKAPEVVGGVAMFRCNIGINVLSWEAIDQAWDVDSALRTRCRGIILLCLGEKNNHWNALKEYRNGWKENAHYFRPSEPNGHCRSMQWRQRSRWWWVSAKSSKPHLRCTKGWRSQSKSPKLSRCWGSRPQALVDWWYPPEPSERSSRRRCSTWRESLGWCWMAQTKAHGGYWRSSTAVERHPPWQNFLQIWPETKATWLEAIAGAAAKISKRSGTLCPENWHQPAARRSRRSPPQLECKLLNTHSRALHIPQEALSLAGYCARQTPRALPWWRRSWFSYPRRWWRSGRYPQRDQWQFLPAYIAGKPPTGPSCPHPTRRWWEWARLQTWWHRPSTLCHLVVRRPAKKSARFAWEVLRVETRLSRFEMPLLHLEVSPASSSRRARGCHSSPHNLGTWSWKPATKFALVEVPQGFPDFPDFPPANWRHVLPLPLVGIPTRSFHGLLHPGSALWQRRYVNPAAGWQLGGNGSGKMGQLVLWFTVTVGRMLTTHPN